MIFFLGSIHFHSFIPLAPFNFILDCEYFQCFCDDFFLVAHYLTPYDAPNITLHSGQMYKNSLGLIWLLTIACFWGAVVCWLSFRSRMQIYFNQNDLNTNHPHLKPNWRLEKYDRYTKREDLCFSILVYYE